ncbi:hypothetical protein EMIHUDRAFT_70903, partial [Emiliania huxleyi CCMP1516]|uniref:Helicase ATP-binding domain-containing protein n=2 Tax=Emiliania huxleyi TaxID=2903 RepID=A0A0D3KK42_EMIH1
AQLLQTLRKYFGHEAFRGSQEEVILKLLQGNHVFYQERTGLGKSLVYQLPALLETPSKGRITLVISPLRSLMQNQVMQL